MSEIKIDELNSIIKVADFEGLMYSSTYTPKINELKIQQPTRICSLDARNEIRSRFINYKFPENQKIHEDLYTYVVEFLLADNIPEEEKNIVCTYLDEDLKNYIYDNYLNEDLKLKFKKYPKNDFGMDIWYQPKKNGVPLKEYFIKNELLNHNIISISFEQFNDVINGNEKPSTNNLICLRHLINESNLLKKKWCPKKIKDIMNRLIPEEWDKYENDMCLKNDKLMRDDLTKIYNKHDVHINEDFKKEILESIPEALSTLEKSIYIYSKLCQILSYDPIYYVDEKSKENESVSNIENYNSLNNNVVCYEFSYIYSDLLQEIGITNIKEKSLKDGNFKNMHANIQYLIDDLVIFADSTTTVNEGDLGTAKYSNETKGIRCELYDEDSQRKFKIAKEKVKLYLEKENALLSSMLSTKEQIQDLSVNDRIILLNNYLVSCNLTNSDFISYTNKLISILDLNIETKLFYDIDTTSRFLLQFNLPVSYNNYEKNTISYTIDSLNKKIYDEPTDEYKYKENITNKHI